MILLQFTLMKTKRPFKTALYAFDLECIFYIHSHVSVYCLIFLFLTGFSFIAKVGHTKGYVQVLVIAPESMLGTSAIVKITSVGRWSVFGEVIETINHMNVKSASRRDISSQDKCSPCSDPNECACTREPEACASCGPESCGGQTTLEESAPSRNPTFPEDPNSRNLIGWLLRKRKNHVHKRVEGEIASGSKEKQEWARGSMDEWGVVDKALLGGMLVSFLKIMALLIHLGVRTVSSN